MHSIRFNPVYPFMAITLAFFAGQDFIKRLASQIDAKFSIMLFVQGGFFILAIICFVAFLTRKYIIIDAANLYIRETCLRSPQIVPLSEIAEVYFGVQDWGFWTRGRKVLSIKMKDGNVYHFFSAGFLTDKKKVGLATYLRSIGVTVIFDKSAQSTGMPNTYQAPGGQG